MIYKGKKYTAKIEKDKVVGYINGGKVIEISLECMDAEDIFNYCYFELGKIDTEMREQEKLLRIMEDARKWIRKKLTVMAG